MVVWTRCRFYFNSGMPTCDPAKRKGRLFRIPGKKQFFFSFWGQHVRVRRLHRPCHSLGYAQLKKKRYIYLYTYAFRESVLLELIGLEVLCGEEREDLSFLSKSHFPSGPDYQFIKSYSLFNIQNALVISDSCPTCQLYLFILSFRA